jgi:hypothetical protein
VPATVADVNGANRSVLIQRHDGRQFLCLVGTREYHKHSDHDGDLWLLYRDQGYGTLASICENVLATMTSAIAGLTMQMQIVPLVPSAELPLEQAQQTARQARAVHDQQIALYNQQLQSVADGA